MNYQETLEYLFNQLPMFQRQGKSAYKADLVNTLLLDEHFCHPHCQFKSIHIAGTNGKGSTSHMLASVLGAAGYKVGLYTSPHLRDFRERIKVDGVMISEESVVQFVETNKSIFEQVKPSFFEMTVALAFSYFAEQKVDVAVVEVGLGGRLDSTNIITPELCVITNIGLDHTDLLGDTIEKIAGEKAGIIKPGVPVVQGESNIAYNYVFEQKAKEQSAPYTLASDVFRVESSGLAEGGLHWFSVSRIGSEEKDFVEVDLAGDYQAKNVITVLAALDRIKDIWPNVNAESIKTGLRNAGSTTGLLGRWQVLAHNPMVVCDTGHNVDGISYVVKQLARTPHSHLHMVIGMVADKDIRGVLQLLPVDATYYFTNAAIPRAMEAEALQKLAAEFGLKGDFFTSVDEALREAKKNAKANDLVFIGGSTFVVAEVV
ncbi:bifunctional folylpolyglutamate synthase/dihydrofolate synthase [Williamwhitmania taraxaci]|uniref:Dihydrofolate synthase/folylpolyglutamate synthase n=1 Tax=Williamwhitmania taraxaci TaxID=1640674 RepID=A0A1G6GR65_9BACT|nr:folylpolyglutamate synthase/dihydrofolate synthase family protein [Williamwhitmania taraxaci]SDB84438.1 dihydrofolate synthase / folylpolyglutamate synthase [Williamwhitmania taraxaci]